MQIKMLHGQGSQSVPLDPEFIDVAVRNVHGASITAGLPAVFANLAASADGASAILPVTTCQRTFAGIALRTIPSNGIGLVRAYGYMASVAIFALGTSATVAIDEVLGVGVGGSLGVNSTGLKTLPGGFVVNLEAIGAAINSPGGYVKGFVRAL